MLMGTYDAMLYFYPIFDIKKIKIIYYKSVTASTPIKSIYLA